VTPRAARTLSRWGREGPRAAAPFGRLAAGALALAAAPGCWELIDVDEKRFTLEMVEVVHDDASFLIDATEVTVAAYQRWLEAAPALEGQDARCGANDSFAPGTISGISPCTVESVCDDYDARVEAADHPDNPVRCVDWCDAMAYCAGQGKHLCRGFGGAALDFDGFADLEASEWAYACTNGDPRNVFPYGPTPDAAACNTEIGGSGRGGVVDVGTLPCEGAVRGLYDMSGNVDEWVDACRDGEVDAPFPQVECVRAGGAYYSSTDGSSVPTCTGIHEFSRACQSNTTGFRCCALPD
jgi:formylglycine-generating enzyme